MSQLVTHKLLLNKGNSKSTGNSSFFIVLVGLKDSFPQGEPFQGLLTLQR